MSSDSTPHEPEPQDPNLEDTPAPDDTPALDHHEAADPGTDGEAVTEVVSKPSPDKPAARGVAGKAAKRAGANQSGADPAAERFPDRTANRGAGGRQFTITVGGLVRALVALLAVAALVAIGLLSWQLIEKTRTLNAFDQSKEASSSFVTTYFDSMMAPNATPEGIQATIVPLTTGEARDRVKADSETTVKMVQEAKFANMQVDVTAVTVESFSADKATTVVGATLKGTSATEPAGGQQVVLLQLDLVKEDGTWLVGQMIPQPGVTVAGDQAGAPVVPQQDPAAPGGQPAPAPAAPEVAPGG